MKQIHSNYTVQDKLVWKTLFDRQKHNLQNKACSQYLQALEKMESVLNVNDIPDFIELNVWFSNSTGWQIHCVPGLIPVDEFFSLLADKKFSSSTWLRKMSQLDYLEEPDMFHDVFGHIPLLSLPSYSKFMHDFGILGKQFSAFPEIQVQLQRLYWYTIEFGLIQQDNLKIYGAGILSSFGESISSIDSSSTKYTFDLEKVLGTDFKNDQIQNHYFVIDTFESLFESIVLLTNKWQQNELVIKQQ